MANSVRINICAENRAEFVKLEGRVKIFNEHYSLEGVGTATATCSFAEKVGIVVNATSITPDKHSKIERISMRAKEGGSDKPMSMARMVEATNNSVRIYLGRNEYIIGYNPE